VSFDFEYPTRALRERPKYEVVITTPMIWLDVKEHPGANGSIHWRGYGNLI
jgi:hypothetical protein